MATIKDRKRKRKAFHGHRTFHDKPTCNRAYVPCHSGIGVAVCCTTCGVVADVEGLGGFESLDEIEVTK